jgi:hypothetical protein
MEDLRGRLEPRLFFRGRWWLGEEIGNLYIFSSEMVEVRGASGDLPFFFSCNEMEAQGRPHFFFQMVDRCELTEDLAFWVPIFQMKKKIISVGIVFLKLFLTLVVSVREVWGRRRGRRSKFFFSASRSFLHGFLCMDDIRGSYHFFWLILSRPRRGEIGWSG